MKIGFLSLGCPKNLVDGEVMLGIAREAGHEIIQDAAAADVLVVNTCAFIDNAKEESINAILEMAALKGQGKDKRLVVTGCLAERYRDELRKEIPEIDALLGTGEVPLILDAIGARDSGLGTRQIPRRCDGYTADLDCGKVRLGSARPVVVFHFGRIDIEHAKVPVDIDRGSGGVAGIRGREMRDPDLRRAEIVFLNRDELVFGENGDETIAGGD